MLMVRTNMKSSDEIFGTVRSEPKPEDVSERLIETLFRSWKREGRRKGGK